MNTPMPFALPQPRQAQDATDAQLVTRVLGGDLDAYTGLVHRHQGAIYRHARGLGLDHDTSVDVVQDAFVKAYDRLSDCREGTNFKAWLFRICRNLCFDELRNVRRRLSVPMSDVELVEALDPADGPDELTLTLREALNRVPTAQRDAFLLKHDAGYTYEEIAELTEASPSAVKMRVQRARDALRAFLVRQGVGGGENLQEGCDNPASVERLRIVDGTERQASPAQANGAPAKTIRRMS